MIHTCDRLDVSNLEIERMTEEKGTTFRARLSTRAKEAIEKIAKYYNCTYGGKGSISDLLNKIADGHLVVKRATGLEKTISGNSLIKLKIKAQTDIRGTIYKISQKIADFGGNILDIKVTREEEFGIFNLLVSLEKDSDLIGLLNALLEIKIEDVQDFNSEKILENKRLTRKFEYSSLSKFKQQSLLIDVRCIIGLKIHIPNKRGILAQITQIIADKKVLIESVAQDFAAQEENAIVKLFLLLKLETEAETKTEVDKINEIMKEIGKKFEVERLNAEFLI